MKILVRLPNWLGDVVMSTAFIDAVKAFYPDATVDVIVKKELRDIALLIPGLSNVYSFSKTDYKGLSGAYRFGKKLGSEKYDLFFNLPSSLSSLVLGWATCSKKRIGFRGEGGFLLLTHSLKKPANVQRVDEYVSLLEQFTGHIIGNKKVALLAADPVKENLSRVLINFNSEASSRRMPLDKGISITKLLLDTFKNTTFTFIGAPKEAAFIELLITGIKNPSRIENFAGKTNLSGLADLMAGSSVLLTTDSGPAHLANSVGTPVIVLFGAGNEHNTAPYNRQNLTVLRYGKLPCEPCLKNTCQLYGVPKCMELLDELRIINAMRVYLPHA